MHTPPYTYRLDDGRSVVAYRDRGGGWWAEFEGAPGAYRSESGLGEALAVLLLRDQGEPWDVIWEDDPTWVLDDRLEQWVRETQQAAGRGHDG